MIIIKRRKKLKQWRIIKIMTLSNINLKVDHILEVTIKLIKINSKLTKTSLENKVKVKDHLMM